MTSGTAPLTRFFQLAFVVLAAACTTGSAVDVSWRLIAVWPDASADLMWDAGADASIYPDCATAGVSTVRVSLASAARADAGVAQPESFQQDCASGRTRVNGVGTDVYTVTLTALDCSGDGGVALGVATFADFRTYDGRVVKTDLLEINVTTRGLACTDAGTDGGS